MNDVKYYTHRITQLIYIQKSPKNREHKMDKNENTLKWIKEHIIHHFNRHNIALTQQTFQNQVENPESKPNIKWNVLLLLIYLQSTVSFLFSSASNGIYTGFNRFKWRWRSSEKVRFMVDDNNGMAFNLLCHGLFVKSINLWSLGVTTIFSSHETVFVYTQTDTHTYQKHLIF